MLKAVIFLLTVFLSESSQQCFSSNDSSPIVTNNKYHYWKDIEEDFSVSLLHVLNKDNNKENVIFSPSSLYEILLLAYFGAAHETEASLAKVLKMNTFLDKSDVWRIYRTRRLIASEEGMGSYPLKTANKLFFSNKLSLRPCVKENLKKEIEMIDYHTNIQWAQSYINKYVEDATDGEIKGFFDNLSPDTTVTLVNAVLFKEKWENKFNPNHTQYLPFHVNSKITKTTSMMVKTDQFLVGHESDVRARVLKLPYVGGRQAMIILLPDEDLDTMMESLNTNTIRLLTYTNLLKTEFLNVMIPKFKGGKKIAMNPILEKLGIGNAIGPDADYSRFTGRKGVYFNKVLQEAMIQVDEEGTKAAAASGGAVVKSQLIPTQSFICDRPFAYFIYDFFTSKILFMGTFRQPYQEE